MFNYHNRYCDISVNINAIAKFGLITAVYLSEIIDNCYLSQVRNNVEAYRGKPYYFIDKCKVEKETTIPESKQRTSLNVLAKCGIVKIHPHNKDYVFIDIKSIDDIFNQVCTGEFSINCSCKADSELEKEEIMGSNELITAPTMTKGVEKKETKAHTKDMSIEEKIKYISSYLSTPESDTELFNLYKAWMYAFYDKYHFITYPTIKLIEDDIKSFSNGNRNVEVWIMKYMARTGYKDAKWAIEAFKNSDGVAEVKPAIESIDLRDHPTEYQEARQELLFRNLLDAVTGKYRPKEEYEAVINEKLSTCTGPVQMAIWEDLKKEFLK